MDKTSGSSFRATPPAGGTPQTPGRVPDPDPPGGGLCVPQSEAAKARLLPADTNGGGLDAERIGKGAIATAFGQGTCFGTAFAFINHLRFKGKAYPKLNTGVGALLPAFTGYLTAPAQRAMFKALDYQSTQMPQDSLAHDAIPSVMLYAVNIAWARATFLPKPAAGTPAAAGVTLMLSMVGTGLAGAASEAIAQWAGGKPAPLPDDDEVHRKGVGRAVSLLPMGAANFKAWGYVQQLGKIPDDFKRRPLQIAVVGWAFRNKLMPEPSLPAVPTTPLDPDGAAHNEPPPDHNT